MANPAAFERELRVVFGRLQHELASHYSFENVDVISPLFRYSSEPVAAPTLPFPGLDDALLKCKALRRPNYSCGIEADNMVHGGMWVDAFIRFWISTQCQVEEQYRLRLGDYR
jgi:hypothetical protein